MYNILFLPSWYPTRENPLSGSFFREQALALSKNYNFSVLHFNFYEINFINYLWKYINHITFKIQVDSDLSLTDVTLDIYNPKLGTFFTFLFIRGKNGRLFFRCMSCFLLIVSCIYMFNTPWNSIYDYRCGKKNS